MNVSLEILTTGPDPQVNQMVEIVAIVDNPDKPIDKCSMFHCCIRYPNYTGSGGNLLRCMATLNNTRRITHHYNEAVIHLDEFLRLHKINDYIISTSLGRFVLPNYSKIIDPTTADFWGRERPLLGRTILEQAILNVEWLRCT